jgi:diaminobutyrate-2-oxoglutarate transaminase
MPDFNIFHLSNDVRIVSETIPGPESQKLLKRQKEIEGNIVSYPVKMPIAIKRAKGAIIEDVDGNRFIDFFAGCGVVNVGHCNPDVLEYVKEQQELLIHALDFPTQNKIDLIEKILNELPAEIRDDFKVSFCGPTGSDAVEAAIKLAKHKTGRETIIAFHGSYHGMTSGALSLTSNNFFRNEISSLIPNVHFIPYSYCYRCPLKRDNQNCQLDCASYLEYILENPHSGISKPAAILIEPIQGEGGNVVPKEGYLEKIIEIANKHDIVVIFDEIQSGFYRTGKFLASQNGTAVPDIYTISKGLGGVGFPISAIIYKKSIESWGPGFHVGTFRGNQVSIAASHGAFDFVKKHEIEKHTLEMSAYLFEHLNRLSQESSIIGEVRGVGLLIGIEFVKDKESKEPFPEIIKQIRSAAFQQGLLFEVGGHFNNVIRFVPPLIINKEIIDNAIQIFQKVLIETESSVLQN